jgi:hypothetical protein
MKKQAIEVGPDMMGGAAGGLTGAALAAKYAPGKLKWPLGILSGIGGAVVGEKAGPHVAKAMQRSPEQDMSQYYYPKYGSARLDRLLTDPLILYLQKQAEQLEDNAQMIPAGTGRTEDDKGRWTEVLGDKTPALAKDPVGPSNDLKDESDIKTFIKSLFEADGAEVRQKYTDKERKI